MTTTAPAAPAAFLTFLNECLKEVTVSTPMAGMNLKWFVELAGPGFTIQAEFDRIDTETGQPGRGTGRKWFIQPGTSKTGVVKTAWCAFKAIVDHEAMHAFHFKGRPLFDPHAEIEQLHAISETHPHPDDYGDWQTVEGAPRT